MLKCGYHSDMKYFYSKLKSLKNRKSLNQKNRGKIGKPSEPYLLQGVLVLVEVLYLRDGIMVVDEGGGPGIEDWGWLPPAGSPAP